jgi:hypothetical protein
VDQVPNIPGTPITLEVLTTFFLIISKTIRALDVVTEEEIEVETKVVDPFLPNRASTTPTTSKNVRRELKGKGKEEQTTLLDLPI